MLEVILVMIITELEENSNELVLGTDVDVVDDVETSSVLDDEMNVIEGRLEDARVTVRLLVSRVEAVLLVSVEERDGILLLNRNEILVLEVEELPVVAVGSEMTVLVMLMPTVTEVEDAVVVVLAMSPTQLQIDEICEV